MLVFCEADSLNTASEEVLLRSGSWNLVEQLIGREGCFLDTLATKKAGLIKKSTYGSEVLFGEKLSFEAQRTVKWRARIQTVPQDQEWDLRGSDSSMIELSCSESSSNLILQHLCMNCR